MDIEKILADWNSRLVKLNAEVAEMRETLANRKGAVCPVCGKKLGIEDYETYYDDENDDSSYYVLCSKCGYSEEPNGH